MIRVRVTSELIVQALTAGEKFPGGKVVSGLPKDCRLVWARPVLDPVTSMVNEVEIVFATKQESEREDRVVLLGRAYVGHGVTDLMPAFAKD